MLAVKTTRQRTSRNIYTRFLAEKLRTEAVTFAASIVVPVQTKRYSALVYFITESKETIDEALGNILYLFEGNFHRTFR